MKFVINMGGWYVGNSAVVDFYSQNKEIEVVCGDLDFFREENGLIDFISNKTSIIKYAMFSTRFIFRAFRRSFILRFIKRSQINNLKNINNKPIKLIIFFIKSFNSKKNQSIKNLFSKEMVLLSNPTYYDNIKKSDFFKLIPKNFAILFIFRNPKMQYLALSNDNQLKHNNTKFRENIGNVGSLDMYHALNKKIYIGRKLLLSNFYNSVHLIRFESFVSSSEYRKKISNNIGIKFIDNKILDTSKKNIFTRTFFSKSEFDVLRKVLVMNINLRKCK